MNPEVDRYIESSELWPDEIARLRPILLEAGLPEEIKWRKPCYSIDGKNVVIVQEMIEFLALMFFKGALLADEADVLRDQGPNSRSARRMEFRSVDEIDALRNTLLSYLSEAIEVERSGLTVGPAPELALVDELRVRLDTDPELAAAFEALTPGRQREYNLYFSGAKQAATRTARIEKYAAKILAGKGFRDR